MSTVLILLTKHTKTLGFKGIGTGGDVSPPILETSAFVPRKNYTAEEKSISF